MKIVRIEVDDSGNCGGCWIVVVVGIPRRDGKGDSSSLSEAISPSLHSSENESLKKMKGLCGG